MRAVKAPKILDPMNRIKSESGQLTLDFLFACVLIMSTAGLVSVLCIGLTLAEVVQYVTFSGSRSYFAGDTTVANQVQAAGGQAQSLINNLPFLNGAIKNNWINVNITGAQDYKTYALSKGADDTQFPDKFQFVGYQIIVKFRLLTFKFPLFGDMVQSPTGEPVQATVGSYIMREPATEECTTLMNAVYGILLSKGYSGGGITAGGGFAPTVDNGC